MEINHSTIKENNRKMIIKLLLRKNEITKLDISRELDISITTVATNINELKKLNIVEDVRSLESTGGRKAISVRIDENCRYSIGISITAHHIKAALINLKGIVVDSIEIRHDNEHIDSIVAAIKEMVDKFRNDYNISDSKLLGVGVSIPGLVDSNQGIIKSCYFLNTKNYNIKDKLSSLGVPIYVDNEADLSAFYEFIVNNDATDSLLYISITDGIGLGIIIDGKIYKGCNNVSGEMGHMKIVVDGKQCKCGAKGCLEAYVNKEVLINEYNHKAMAFLDNIEEFEKIYNASDDTAMAIMNEYINMLGIGISNLIMILDPKNIVIGGDINSLLSSNIDNIRKVINQNTIYINEVNQNLNIRIAKFKESYLLGAAMVPIEEFLSIK